MLFFYEIRLFAVTPRLLSISLALPTQPALCHYAQEQILIAFELLLQAKEAIQIYNLGVQGQGINPTASQLASRYGITAKGELASLLQPPHCFCLVCSVCDVLVNNVAITSNATV